MTTIFPFDPEGRKELEPRDTTGVSPDLDAYARVEGLAGEEEDLLAIPAAERTKEHHERLRAVSEELDRIRERLHERAQRHHAAGD
jgi:hypothetical protein